MSFVIWWKNEFSLWEGLHLATLTFIPLTTGVELYAAHTTHCLSAPHDFHIRKQRIKTCLIPLTGLISSKYSLFKNSVRTSQRPNASIRQELPLILGTIRNGRVVKLTI